MQADTERRDAQRLLSGLENGGLSAADAYTLAQNIDPVLCHVIVSYLRECYPASDPAAPSVLARVVKLTSTYPGFVQRCKEGERDPIARWFESEHPYRDYRGRGGEMIAAVCEKLDS